MSAKRTAWASAWSPIETAPRDGSEILCFTLNADYEIAHWLESHPTVKLAFQPGTFQIEVGIKRLKKIYELSEVLAVNREEATTISSG